jgi:hypothetical protein
MIKLLPVQANPSQYSKTLRTSKTSKTLRTSKTSRALRTLSTSLTLLISLTPALAQDCDECTVALIAGWAQPNGRPIIWKNRDVSNYNQEFLFYDETPYSFISVTYAGNDTETWGGVNNAGFGIMNANALNFPDLVAGLDDDGIIIYHALQTCETVDDFLAYMDTTAHSGRTRTAIYGVFDAFGGCGMLEAAAYDNYWFDGNDTTLAPQGIMVRANFAYQGGTNHVGQFRHDRALWFLDSLMQISEVNPRNIINIVARDLATDSINPYPLPWEGSWGDTLFGYIDDHNAINREISQSAFVLEGIAPGENPLTATLWAMCGEPIMTPAIPLWVAAEATPAEVNGNPTAPICNRARQFFNFLYYPAPDPNDDLIDTWKVVNDQGYGLLPYIQSIENGYFGFVEAQVAQWRTEFPAMEVILNLQDSLASVAYNAMKAYLPPVQTCEVHPEGGDLRLNWSPVDFSIYGNTITISGYTIFSDENYPPFSTAQLGDSLGFTSDTTYLLQLEELPERLFLQIRATVW